MRRKVNMGLFDWKGFSASMVGMLIGIGITFGIAALTFPAAASKSQSNNEETIPFLVSDNPTLMHMHRREFIAAAIAQGLASTGYINNNVVSPDEFAKRVLSYTDALMRALDK